MGDRSEEAVAARLRIACWVTIVLSFCVTCYAAYHRPPWSDEGLFSSAAHNFARTNTMGTPVLHPRGNGWNMTGIERHTYWVFPGLLVGQGLWYKVFPSTLFWTRAFSIAWFPLLLASVFFYLRRLLPEMHLAPWFAVMLLAGNFVAIDNAGFARPEMAGAALGLASMAIYLHWREQHLGRALFAAQLLVALGGLMHPNGIFHWIGLQTLILWTDGKKVLRPSMLGVAVVPYLLLGGAWAAYLLQDVQALRDQLGTNTVGRWATTFNPIVILQNELARYWQNYGLVTGGMNRLKLFGLALSWGSVAACLSISGLRKRSGVALLLVQTGLYFLALSIFNQKLTYYLLHIVPFYLMLAGIWLEWLWENKKRLRPLIQVAVAALLILEMGGIALKSRTRSYIATQQAVVHFLQQNARPNDLINGTSAMLYEMKFDPRLRDDAYLGTWTGDVPDFIVIEQLYTMLHEVVAKDHPADMQAIRERLADYDVAFRRDEYTVLMRKERIHPN